VLPDCVDAVQQHDPTGGVDQPAAVTAQLWHGVVVVPGCRVMGPRV